MSWMATWPDNHWFIHHDAPAGPLATSRSRCTGASPSPSAIRSRLTRLPARRCSRRSSTTRRRMASRCASSPSPRRSRTGDAAQVSARCSSRRRRSSTCRAWSSRASRGRACAPPSTGPARTGITYREGRLAEMPRGMLTQVRAISELWVVRQGPARDGLHARRRRRGARPRHGGRASPSTPTRPCTA